ncbi:ABC transporter E member 2 [Salvia divinorum]|uniref:ABC transporter E member 2 n=1 Tax=Salvia divinorum TaxID=28513 RepID=A0ABD1HE38_SALDI
MAFSPPNRRERCQIRNGRIAIASDKDTTHRYGPNSFKLLRLPVPRYRDLAKIKPNLGHFDDPPGWKEIFNFFQESELHELHNYFNSFVKDKLKASIKPQYISCIPKVLGDTCTPKVIKGKIGTKVVRLQRNVGQFLTQGDERDMKQELAADLELIHVMDRNVGDLSGGELQKFAIAIAALRNADIYLFDEPSSYLDVKQRLKAARVIRSLLQPNIYVIVVEHDLSVLEYLSDFICCLYGRPGKYGAVTLPFSVREGINVFLAGFVPTENFTFRAESLTFNRQRLHKKVLRKVKHVQDTMLLGENGTGKSTFLQMLAGFLKPDSVEGSDGEIPDFSASYKQQKMRAKMECTVRSMLHTNIRDSYMDPQFVSDVMEPLLIKQLMDKKLVNLSGGELQRVALTLCLGKPADIYLIDEPSAFLDSEQRIVASKVIKKFIRQAKKAAFVVEHDFMMATYLADRVIVYEGKPSIDCVGNSPQSLLTGMNLFLSHLDITCRRDPTSLRPRINKHESTEYREQKSAGSHYYMDD